MAQLIVRNLDDNVKERLRRRARDHGRSMEKEARAILKDAVATAPDDPVQYGLGTQIAQLFAGVGLKDEEIASFEIRGQEARPAKFD